MTARHNGAQDWKIWVAISILFLGLGINKQLDLQSALTELGRTLAFQYGWYEQRESVQIEFIIFVTTVCAVAVVAVIVGARRSGPAAWFAILGTTLVIGFVLIRAASFHHIDRFIGQKILGFRLRSAVSPAKNAMIAARTGNAAAAAAVIAPWR